GRTALRMRFAGRIDEAAKVRGMFVYPEQIGEALERFGSVAPWRAIVSSDDRGLDVLTVEIEGALDEGAREKIGTVIRAAVRVRAEVVSVASVPAEGPRLEDRRAR
ncbi:MAG: phenylacetate--CoA ligase family protein, partial [Actinomycetota bacterium]